MQALVQGQHSAGCYLRVTDAVLYSKGLWMITEMDGAKPATIRVISARKVVFTFDLTQPENELLREREVLTRSMASYMLAHPRFESYRAEYVVDQLVLTCTGTLNQRYAPHVDEYL